MADDTNPEFGGQCALGVSMLGDKAPKGNPKHALVKDGKTYYFTSGASKFLYEHVPGVASRAEKKGAKIAA